MKWFKCRLLFTRMCTFSFPSIWTKIVSEVTELKMNNTEWWNSNSPELHEFVGGSELARFGACCQINKVALTLQIFLITIPIQSEKWLFVQWSFSGIKFVLQVKDEQDSATYPCHTPLLKNMMIHKDVNIGVVEKMYIYNPTSPFLNAYIETLSLWRCRYWKNTPILRLIRILAKKE